MKLKIKTLVNKNVYQKFYLLPQITLTKVVNDKKRVSILFRARNCKNT